MVKPKQHQDGASEKGIPLKKRAVSVVVLTKNSIVTIQRCVDSLINQTVQPREIIVVDGGSTDGTLELVKKYPIRLIEESTSSIGHARNLGVKNAKGRIVFFLDSDCYCVSNWIESMLPHFDRGEIVGVAGRIVAWEPKSLLAKYQAVLMDAPKDHAPVGRAPNCNLALRKKAIVSAGGFDEGLDWSEDLDLLHRLTTTQAMVIRENKALVYHKLPETYSEFFKKRIRAAISGGQIFAKYGMEFGVPRSLTYSALFLTYLISVIFSSLFIQEIIPSLLLLPVVLSVLKIALLYNRYRTATVVAFPSVFLTLCIAYLNFYQGFIHQTLLKTGLLKGQQRETQHR